ncbi:MAG: hypothetical protein Q7S79_03920 [bacterium]|nr:hypothetical protein [bacterium]
MPTAELTRDVVQAQTRTVMELWRKLQGYGGRDIIIIQNLLRASLALTEMDPEDDATLIRRAADISTPEGRKAASEWFNQRALTLKKLKDQYQADQAEAEYPQQYDHSIAFTDGRASMCESTAEHLLSY